MKPTYTIECDIRTSQGTCCIFDKQCPDMDESICEALRAVYGYGLYMGSYTTQAMYLDNLEDTQEC